MQPNSQSAPPSKGRAGRIIGAIPIVMLLFSAVMNSSDCLRWSSALRTMAITKA